MDYLFNNSSSNKQSISFLNISNLVVNFLNPNSGRKADNFISTTLLCPVADLTQIPRLGALAICNKDIFLAKKGIVSPTKIVAIELEEENQIKLGSISFNLNESNQKSAGNFLPQKLKRNTQNGTAESTNVQISFPELTINEIDEQTIMKHLVEPKSVLDPKLAANFKAIHQRNNIIGLICQIVNCSQKIEIKNLTNSETLATVPENTPLAFKICFLAIDSDGCMRMKDQHFLDHPKYSFKGNKFVEALNALSDKESRAILLVMKKFVNDINFMECSKKHGEILNNFEEIKKMPQESRSDDGDDNKQKIDDNQVVNILKALYACIYFMGKEQRRELRKIFENDVNEELSLMMVCITCLSLSSL